VSGNDEADGKVVRASANSGQVIRLSKEEQAVIQAL